ncbi:MULTISPECIES: DUF6461 domain-containing protein [unclassified Streptomyces]|uniref:DUF6461 domain-containing protein n=1 Tax=Streptomyces sp. NBC_00060 TaxID=2975636 RepID=A0AAU2HD89_9ACTN
MTGRFEGRGLDLLRGDFPFYTVTFVRDLAPSELLMRMGADPSTVAVRDMDELAADFGDYFSDEIEPVVSSGTTRCWSWAWEEGGVHGLHAPILRAVSIGTEAVVLHHNEKMDSFA